MNRSVKKVSLFAAQLVLASSLFAVSWTGGGSNELFDPVNWGGTVMDGTDNTADFWNAGPLSLVTSKDTSIKRLLFYKQFPVEIDLQSHTLTANQDIQANSGIVLFRNGVISHTANTMRIGNSGNNACLTLEGANMSATVKAILIGQSGGASFNTLVITNGASFTINSGVPLANAGNSISSNNAFVVTGKGSLLTSTSGDVTIGHQACGGNNCGDVRNEGRVECVKTIIGNVTNSMNNALLVHDFGCYTNKGDLVIGNVARANSNRAVVFNGGTLYVKDIIYISHNGASMNELTVSNATAYVGRVRMALNNASTDNAVRVVDGELTCAGEFRVGWVSESDRSSVILCNGKITSADLAVGKNDPTYIRDNRIVFAGTNDTWTMTGNASLKSGTILEVDVPEEGRDPSAVCLTSGGSLDQDGTLRIVVNAEKHAKNLAQTTTYPLVRVKNQIAASVLDHVTVDLPDHVTVALTEDKKGVDITIRPYRIGLTVIVR